MRGKTIIFSEDLTDVTLIIKDGQQFKAHWVIMLVTIAMVHTYYMELQDRQARDFLDFKLGAKSPPPSDSPDIRRDGPWPSHGPQHLSSSYSTW